MGEVGDVLVNDEELQYSLYGVIVMTDVDMHSSLIGVMVAVTVTVSGP
jgi:hypothetical protein